ncbi:molybdenum cofactor guanylyltransferase [Paenibacillus sp. OAS669]|uniref:molybdenum cofactor guanylyltransferase n=1 Tax=Paenibacillus sp. OAS669 TaxID=2663821 RepID=UPI00178A0F1C|nr:molybdenum cofactor guanylyltransferase [Paenibacillus sp. OAS669]MBE1442221.1 molybdopterin-guanine dinucleotide biosynthesis protein A [Paenibacillus sp. OAS669]
MDDRQKWLTGVILAGGQNRRMGGQPKAMLKLQGRSFVERQLEELGKVCKEILIIANDAALFEKLVQGANSGSIRIIPDQHPGKGPLAGMQAAMRSAQGEAMWVVACDMPHVSGAAACAMMEELDLAGQHWDAVVPVLHGKIQPLHAVYRIKSCREIVDDMLETAQYKVMELLQRLNYRETDEQFFARMGIAADFALNINEPAQYEQLLGLRTDTF